MEPKAVSLAEAKARLSELATLAASGQDVVITRRGKLIVRLSCPEAPRQAVDVDALRAVTSRLSVATGPSGEFIRGVRDDSRY